MEMSRARETIRAPVLFAGAPLLRGPMEVAGASVALRAPAELSFFSIYCCF
jgi:hypothetical protein